MSNQTRILEAALQLFNATSAAEVSTNHIAAAAGISPGNLYYHFKNKEDIIRQLVESMFERWAAELVLPADRLPQWADVEQLFRLNFQIVWDYRFFYRELLPLLRRDEVLAERFRAVRSRGRADFEQLFQTLVAAQIFAPPRQPGDIAKTAELAWLVSEFWIQNGESGGQVISEAWMNQGLALLRHLFQPHLLTN